MRQFVLNHLDHVLFALILLSRIGDVGSTYLVSPQLKLEGNPLVRRLGWPFALATLLISLVAYYDVRLGVMVLVPSLLVTASNLSRAWLIRALGESVYASMFRWAVHQTTLPKTLALTYLAASPYLVLGVFLVILSGDPEQDLGYWVGAGVIAYAGAVALHSTYALWRLFRRRT